MADIDLEFVLRVLRLFGQTDCTGELFWRTDGDYAPITFFANVNDVFFWGCTDNEKITPDNIAEAEKAVADVRDITGKTGWSTDAAWVNLFAARLRKDRPQGAAYPSDERLWPLFDACGPEREVGLGNPYKPGTYGRCEKEVKAP